MRSKTDMIIVFMTPIAPMPMARTEIARLAASRISKPWSTLLYSSTVLMAASWGNSRSIGGGDLVRVGSGIDGDVDRRDHVLPGRQLLERSERDDRAPVPELVLDTVEPDDLERLAVHRQGVAGGETQVGGGPRAEHGLALGVRSDEPPGRQLERL